MFFFIFVFPLARINCFKSKIEQNKPANRFDLQVTDKLKIKQARLMIGSITSAHLKTLRGYVWTLSDGLTSVLSILFITKCV